MPSVLTDNAGKVIATTPQERDEPWVFVSDSEYIDAGAAPDGYMQSRYLLSESQLAFDKTTAEMGSIYHPIASVDAPNTIPNDGSASDVTFSLLPDETADVSISVADLSDTVTLDPSHVEKVSSTSSAGTLIDVSVSADGIVDATETIEVVKA